MTVFWGATPSENMWAIAHVHMTLTYSWGAQNA
jgi:hypothetical protein